MSIGIDWCDTCDTIVVDINMVMCYAINTVEFRPMETSMYVKIYTRHRGQWEPSMVIELPRSSALKKYKRNYPHRLCLVIPGREAHKWVRQGGVHGTALYIDSDKRIRRAGE